MSLGHEIAIYDPPDYGWWGERPQTPLPERIKTIIRDVARRHGVEPGAIVGPSARRPIAAARFEVCAELRKPGPNGRVASYSQIGRWLGGRDHTTILLAVRRYAERKVLHSEAAAIYQCGAP